MDTVGVRPRPQRVDADRRLHVVVLAPVDQHPALAQLACACCRRPGRDARCSSSCAHRRANGLVRSKLAAAVQRHVDLEPLRPRRLGVALEPVAGRRSRSISADPAALDDRRRRPRVEVEHHRRRPSHVACQRQRGVQLEVGQVRDPEQRGQVVHRQEVDVAAVAALLDCHGPHPVRPVLGRILLVEELAVHAVRVALHGQRPALRRWGRSTRRDRLVVGDHVALGETGPAGTAPCRCW